MNPVDRQTLARKLEYLRKQLAILEDYRKMSKAEIVDAVERRYTVERLLELSIQSVIDCSRLLVGLEDWRAARDEREALLLLAERDVIGDDLAERLLRAKRFRNVLVHEYGRSIRTTCCTNTSPATWTTFGSWGSGWRGGLRGKG